MCTTILRKGPQTAGKGVPDNVRRQMVPRVQAAVQLAGVKSKRRELAEDVIWRGPRGWTRRLPRRWRLQKATEAAAQGQRYKDGWFGDISNSQYGTYGGVGRLDDAGFEMPLAYWKTSDAFWRKHQLANGGWGYTAEDNNLRPNMAAWWGSRVCLSRRSTRTPTCGWNAAGGQEYSRRAGVVESEF